MTAIASEGQAPKQILGLEAPSLRTPNFGPYGPTRPDASKAVSAPGRAVLGKGRSVQLGSEVSATAVAAPPWSRAAHPDWLRISRSRNRSGRRATTAVIRASVPTR